MKVESHNLIDVAKKALIQMGILDYKDVELTYAFKVGNRWRANFSYYRGADFYKRVSSFLVDAETGEIIGVWTDRIWR